MALWVLLVSVEEELQCWQVSERGYLLEMAFVVKVWGQKQIPLGEGVLWETLQEAV